MTAAPTRRLLVSADAAERLDDARAWLAERLRDTGGPGGGEIVVVAPTRGAADDLLRGLDDVVGVFGVHRVTPNQLAADLAVRRMARQGLAPVSRLGVEALAARSVAVRLRADELDYFAPVAETPGFARALASTLRDLRFYEVDVDELATSGAPGADLAALLTTYLEELQARRLVDEAEVHRFAVLQCEAALDDDGRHPLLDRPVLALDLSPQTRIEERFFTALARRAPSFFATAAFGDILGVDALTRIVDGAVEKLSSASAEASDDGRLGRLRRRLFQPVIEPDAADSEIDEDDESVVFLTAPGEGRECVEIARRLLRSAEEGVPFDETAILLRDPEAYLPLVEEALRRAAIPAYFTRGTARPNPAGRAFLALLACAGEDLSASRFAEYLSLGQVPRLDEKGAPPVVEEVPWIEPEGEQLVFKSLFRPPDPPKPEEPEEDEQSRVLAGSLQTPRRWEQLLVDAAVVGGHDRWARRLDGLQEELRLRLAHLDDEAKGKREHVEQQIQRLGYLRSFAVPLVEDLAKLPEEASWGEWIDSLGRLATRALRRPDKVLAVLAELRPMESVGPIGLDEVRRVLDERLSFLRSEPPVRRYGRVFVGSISEARGRSFDTVFLPGLAEGIFPRRSSEDPLLLDDERRSLESASLPLQSERVGHERLLLRIAAGAARRRLTASYPNLDVVQGRSRVPSFYALDLLRAADGEIPDLRRLEARAGAASESLIGWPAPRRADAAIDDAEFDLATLEPLLRSPQTARGKGRYLMENEVLARALRTRYQRWRHRSFTSADGLVRPDAETRDVLAQHRLRNRSYSPTALQSFAICPYRFLLYAIHRLRPRESISPLEQLDPLTRGSLFHEVQFELFNALRERDLLPMREENVEEISRAADEILERVAGEYADRLAPAIQRVWESEINSLGIDLRGWIRTTARAEESWRPAWFELSFGLPLADDRDSASSREPAVIDGDFRLRGSIDLVEVDDERGILRVTDHKTGKSYARRNLIVGGGEILQPVIYALAAERLLGKPVESGRLYYCTRRGEYDEMTVELNEESRRKGAEVLESIDRAVTEGFLPAAPRERGCDWCDYRLVCGPYEQTRTAKKKKEQLVRLQALRDLP